MKLHDVMITYLNLLRWILLATIHIRCTNSLISSFTLHRSGSTVTTLRTTTIPLDLNIRKPQLQLLPNVKDSTVVIIGGGPAGLASAIMLARRGYTKVKVFDRLLEPPAPDDASVWNDFENERSYNIGVNGRGQRALEQLEVLSKVEFYSAKCIGRMEWSPENPGEPKVTISSPSEGKLFNPKIIQRERLASCLLEEIRTKYNDSVSVKYQSDCTSIEWLNTNKDNEVCKLNFVQKNIIHNEIASNVEWSEESSFVVGADGAQSAVRNAMENEKMGGFFVKKYDDKNVRVYRTIPLHFPKGEKEDKAGKKWRGDLNYSVRTKSDINIDALPTKEGPYYGVVLYRPWDDRFSNMKTGADAKAFFEEVLPMFSPILRDADLERFAQQKDSKLPKFSYVGPILHRGKTTCLIGDCIHTVKPYFGVGVNSAFEDVMVLNTALNSCDDNIPMAMEKYSNLRASDTEAIVKMSERLDGGFLSFVLPLIVDSILNKIAPFIFSPNTIRSLQNPDKTFSQIKRRKRADRVMQTMLGVSIIAMMGKALVYSFSILRTVVFERNVLSLFYSKFIAIAPKLPFKFPF